MGRGESKDFSGYEESGFALMSTERIITDLSLNVERESKNLEGLEFHFDQGEIPGDPDKRTYTPAMVWVMAAMKEEYEAWKAEQK